MTFFSFSHHLFNNYLGLEKILNAKETLPQLTSLSKDPKFLQKATYSAPYFSSWQVLWVVCKNPVDIVLTLFFKAISLILHYTPFVTASRFFYVLSKHCQRDWHLLTLQWQLSQTLLVPSFNVPKLLTYDLYKYTFIPVEFIEDDKVLPLTKHAIFYEKGITKALNRFYKDFFASQNFFSRCYFATRHVLNDEAALVKQQLLKSDAYSIKNTIDSLRKEYNTKTIEKPLSKLYKNIQWLKKERIAFDKLPLFFKNGLSKGACLWFIGLYLKASHLFKTPKERLCAVASEFQDGMPRQAAILQALDKTKQLLGLTKISAKSSFISLLELDDQQETIQEKLEQLETGIYEVSIHNYSFVYAKITAQETYVWDPFHGLMESTHQNLCTKLLQQYHKQGDPLSSIRFYKYENEPT